MATGRESVTSQTLRRRSPYAALVNAPRIALVTYAQLPDLDADDAPLLDALTETGAHAQAVVWDDGDVDWASFDLVVVRNTWDYMDRLEEFLAWAERVSQVSTLANPVEVLRWNTDKAYLRDLEGVCCTSR